MPRKQRFKPSRKPKLISTAQAQEAAEIERPSVQLDEIARTPEAERPEPALEPRSQGREEVRAR